MSPVPTLASPESIHQGVKLLLLVITQRLSYLGLCLVLFSSCAVQPAGETASGSADAASQGVSGRPGGPAEAGSGEVRKGPADEPLNVLLITIDTLRADQLSCYGNTSIETPHLDELAERGVRFEQAVVQVPLTLPSHASILTGTYPQTHGVRDIGGFVMKKEVPTLGEITHAAGYRTGAFVAAAVLNRRFQLDRGFQTYDDRMDPDREEDKLPGVVAELRAQVITDRALRWLNESMSTETNSLAEPGFFLWVHYFDPHRPYDPPEPFRSRYPEDRYGAEVAYTDQEIGRLLAFLDTQGLTDRTLVIVLSDHGESLGEHGEYTHGVFLYDSTMKVPLIVAGPGIPGGKVVDQQVRSIDILPTVTDFLDLQAGEQTEGLSLRPLLESGKGVRTTYSYMETLYPKTHMGWAELRGVRTDKWKLIMAPDPELYRMDSDPAEAQNLVQRYPAEADRLQKQIWQVAGPPQSLGELEYQPLDDETREELRSLGYASPGARRDLRIDMSGPDPKLHLKTLRILEDAGEKMNASRFSEAVPLLQQALKGDHANPLLYQHLALCHVRLDQYARALDVYQTAIKNGADTDETYAEMGEIHIRLGRLRPAADVMEEAARRNPTNLQNLSNLSTVYLQLRELDEAQRVLRAILAQDSHNATAYNLLGILAIQRGDDQLAMAQFKRAVEADPTLTEAYMNLGILAQEAGQPQKALDYYRKFVQLASPEDHAEVLEKVKAVIAELESSG